MLFQAGYICTLDRKTYCTPQDRQYVGVAGDGGWRYPGLAGDPGAVGDVVAQQFSH